MTVRVVTDSACDLSDEVVEPLGIEVVPLTIRFGDEELIDRKELGVDEFWRRLEERKHMPETAAPSAGTFEETFRRLVADGATGIVCVNLSSRLSATMQSAQLAARAITEVPVEVIDSESATIGQGNMAIRAAELAQAGAGMDEITTSVRSLVPRTHIVGALDTLEFLRKGGRIGAAQHLIGEVLSVKPCIEVRDGVVAQAGKVRTRSKSFKWLTDKFEAAGPKEAVFVFHANAPDADELLDVIGTTFPRDQIRTGIIGPVIGTHAGPRCIGIGWVDAT